MKHINLDNIKIQAAVLFAVQIVVALMLEFGFKLPSASIILFFILVNLIFIGYLLYMFSSTLSKRSQTIKEITNDNISQVMRYGNVGMVIYDDNYNVIWMSDLFEEREINYVGEKLTMWLPDVNELLQEGVDSIVVDFEGYRYRVDKKDDEQVLFFQDITDFSLLEMKYKNEQVVVGIVHMDNYNDTVQYEDEQKIATINANLRQKVIDWCLKHNMLIRRVRADRFLVVLNEDDYLEAEKEHFSILNEVREQSQSLDVSITLSMAFARGTADYIELDKMVNELLELAQNRGGDQVATRVYGEDYKFIGGSSEAQEKRSRVRVRVMSQTISNMIQSSSNVFIVGHKDMDFDCAGAALGMSRIVTGLGVDCYVIGNDITIENKLERAMYLNNDELVENHNFISEEDALDLVEKDSLIIVVDHHSVGLCNAPKLVEACTQVMIIDHHRRKSSNNINAILVYLEASASSTSELVVELLQYQTDKVELTEIEANVMFAGMVIDTNNFRTRCGTRTFEAAANLRKMGADPLVVDDMLKDSYQEFELRTKILSYSEILHDRYIIAPIVEEGVFERAMLSKAANVLLTIQNVKAAFVIARTDSETIAISARSNGDMNVQTIMEKMQGGGHFSAAALQREDTTVEELKEELIRVIDEYEEEMRESNESDTIE